MSARARKQKATESPEAVSSAQQSTSTTSKSVSVERSRISTSGTPRKSFSRSERSNSPLGISRGEEKEELAHLNDRLAGYIDYVRKLESDKERLTRKVHAVTEERMSKVNATRTTYEDEISGLRNLVDDLAKQKAKSELDAKQAKSDASDAKSKLNQRDQENRNLHRRIENLSKDLATFKEDHERYQPLLADFRTLENRFDEAHRDLEAETLLRTDLENKVLGLKEQLDFRQRLFDEEREKLVHKTTYIEEEVEGRKQAEYNSRLAEELQAIRDQTASELDEYKYQLEETFETKFGNLRSSADHSMEDAQRQRSELQSARKRADDLAHELAKKIAELNLLQNRVEELQNQLERERTEYADQSTFHFEEIRRLKNELEESFREFSDLMNTKIALDQEILMYRKMLEGEESRLNLQSPSRESAFDLQPGKRRRMEDGDSENGESQLTGSSFLSHKSRFAYRVSSSAVGVVELYKEQDTQGKWVKLNNTSTEDVAIGNWELVHVAGGEETRFKFYRSLVLKPGFTCTIWSSDSETTHNPPSDIVMKNKAFHAGPETLITLIDADGVEQAKCTVKRERIRSTGVTFGRRGAIRPRSEEKCMLM